MVERNWAGNVEYRCATVDRPTSVDELRDAVVRSNRIHVLGTRHSFNDIADAERLISLEALPDDVVIDSAPGTVELNPAMTYGRLAPMLHRVGWPSTTSRRFRTSPSAARSPPARTAPATASATSPLR